LFNQSGARIGRKLNLENVYVDQISGEEVEGFVLRDRRKLATDGVVVVLAEVDANGQINNLDIIVRGLSTRKLPIFKMGLVKSLSCKFHKEKERKTGF